jgi:hypothetical protein
MSNQSRKHSLGLAGEFLVAGELLRRGMTAAVTYGNAKKADVIAVYGEVAASLEVKTTSQQKWVLGGQLPENSEDIWVLVFLPEDEEQSPLYHVLTSAELRALVLPDHEAYNQRYRQKHGKDYDKPGVVSIKKTSIPPSHVGAWSKVKTKLGI